MATVRRIARDAGYTFQYHVFDSRRTVYGYPDLTLVHRDPGHPIFMCELKREDGQVTPAQAAWLEALGQCSGVVAEVWRPSMLEDICQKLRG